MKTLTDIMQERKGDRIRLVYRKAHGRQATLLGRLMDFKFVRDENKQLGVHFKLRLGHWTQDKGKDDIQTTWEEKEIFEGDFGPFHSISMNRSVSYSGTPDTQREDVPPDAVLERDNVDRIVLIGPDTLSLEIRVMP